MLQEAQLPRSPSKQAVAAIKDPYSCSSCWISHVEGQAMQEGLRRAAWLPLPRLHTSVHASPRLAQSDSLPAGCVRRALPLVHQGPAWCLVRPQLACLTCLMSPGAARQGCGARGESPQSSKQPTAASASRESQTGAARRPKTMQVAMMGARARCTRMQRKRTGRWAGLCSGSIQAASCGL